MDGVSDPTTHPTTMSAKTSRRKNYTAQELAEGILNQSQLSNQNRSFLSRAITLVESNAPAHREVADTILQALLPHSGKSVRVGITGTPGAGKSTFIEALGTRLCAAGKKVAVLAVDPSSSLTQGSILGDKTRMEKLGREPNAFIRPSPTGGNLGGVTRKSRETVVLCEAAGFDVILVETVGVGQNETTVRSMVDFFLLLMITGGGDELQGIKKGVVELADAILINKADGDNTTRAEAARQEAQNALHYLKPATPEWKPQALKCSSMTGEGVDDVWQMVDQFHTQMSESGQLTANRNQQRLDWMHAMVEQQLISRFYTSDTIRSLLPLIKEQVLSGTIPASAGATHLLKAFQPQETDHG
jgi:LAO/AO transport system kinase